MFSADEKVKVVRAARLAICTVLGGIPKQLHSKQIGDHPHTSLAVERPDPSLACPKDASGAMPEPARNALAVSLGRDR